ncbi:hypothetical protein ACFV0R_18980 [Streptomyces sp. NPDC059578]|uniref:hypothetical protein n=1 Tax=Streptomyces sp. NPDC059578 TaxID=3346874 RepID=UPI0036BA44F4
MKRPRRAPLPPCHHPIVVAALEDWWMAADPAAPPSYTDAADIIDLYLASSGLRIAPARPGRLARAVHALRYALRRRPATGGRIHP